MALSVRGRKALAQVGLEEKLLEHGIPMRGRMLHDLNGQTQAVPYDPNTNQVRNQFHQFIMKLLKIIATFFLLLLRFSLFLLRFIDCFKSSKFFS